METLQVNILGMGVMGCQLAALFSLAGYQVRLWSRRADAKLSPVEREIRLLRRFLNCPEATGKVTLGSDIGQLSAGPTIESVTEDLALKRALHQQLRLVNQEPFFTNSSSYRPEEIGDGVKGLHFFNPVTHLRLIEYVDADHLQSLQSFRSFVESCGFTLVEVKQNRGYVGNYLLFNEISAFFRLLEIWGYDEQTLKVVCASIGHRNAFEVVDFIGVDVCLRILENLHERDAVLFVPDLLRRAVAADVRGKKNGTSLLKFYLQEKAAGGEVAS